MSAPLDAAALADHLARGDWRRRFGGSALAAGQKLARGRQVIDVRAELLDTGDAELTATVVDKDGATHHPVVALWRECAGLALDASCDCAVSTQCEHAAALLELLAKDPETRLQTALGGSPHAETMTQGKSLALPAEPKADPQPAAPPPPVTGETPEPRFLLRLERRPDDRERLAWLPERLAQAWAIYGTHRVPLDPAGQLLPIVTPEGKIRRDRARETAALNHLYALDFLPGAEEPPASLRKLERPPFSGTLWAPNRQEWPHEEFFWQRFRHEGVPALEKRGWEVRFAPDFGLKPLIFRSQAWRAEIVEEGRGWFHLSAGFEIDGEAFELQPILAALVANRFLEVTEGLPDGQEFMIFLPDGRGLALPVGRFRRILVTLGELMDFKFPGGPIRLGALDAALLTAEPGLLPAVEAPPEIAGLAERLTGFDRIDRVPLPSGLRATLREYQLDGYHWMQFLARYRLNGILADDMGLGKTLQTIAHLLAEIESGRHAGRPSLVLAPTSVVMNWQREAAKFAPGLRVLVLQGADRQRHFPRIPSADLVLSSYALIGRDLDAFLAHEFHLLVLDEAQHIKNPGAQVTHAVGRLRAAHRLCLSGTPVENHLGELWSLMHFLMPGLLGGWDRFTETYRTPIEKNGNESRRAALARRVGPLILRRTKHDVAKELPPKTEIVHTIEMSEAQKDLYETVRSTMDKHVRQALAIQGTEARVMFLDALLKLRQICCHPRLLDGRDAPSAKFDHLVDLLDTFRQEGNRVLLFSQFTSMLDLIEAHLVATGCTYLKLTGETRDRQSLVERFQGGEGEVFLISLKAGGTGLTLTGADIVIHYDPWWNPAAENQATDRAYRIGQDKPVFVHKLICQDTVEERIQQMQEKKGDLAGDLLSGATRSLALTPEILAGLLGPSGSDSDQTG
ncbi:MAG: DEAD/DEAH box helicase [Verrucomicrobiales bacterium]|nr:DEAD/DEAH box helicase [Verrucomicrobiales bacterium]